MSPIHLHLLLNHVPVIGTAIALGLLAWAALRGDERVGRASLALLALLAAVALAVFLTGEPAEEAVEGIAGIPEALIERHEEAALLATIALGVLGALSLAALLLGRGRRLSRGAMLAVLALGLVPAGAMAYTANLGGQVRHSEIRPGVVVGGESAVAAEEPRRDEDD
ncbi:MAG: hypothetical protein ACJ8GN_04860 [Longimicrobiaceae bacterium]